MKKTSKTIDYEWESITIAKEITIAKLGNASVTSNNDAIGKDIGEMFLAIHEEVKKAFNESETKD